jgi:phosphoglycerate dehydrogenase-like enzyme
MSLLVYVQDRLEPRSLATLQQALVPEIDLFLDQVNASIHSICQVIVSTHPQSEILSSSPHLHTAIVPWAGVSREAIKIFRQFPQIAVHNLHHNGAATAEMAVTLMLAAAKRIIPADRALRHGNWRGVNPDKPSCALSDQTVLILGYGSIGRRVAAICKNMGMHVLAVRRNISTPESTEYATVYSTDAFPQLLPSVKFLIVCLPLTGKTVGFIGSKELNALPPDAVIVNVGRGPIVDEQALYHALASGHLFGAGLDVWYRYPANDAERSNTLPSGYPFHELDNVVMSPHRADDSPESEVDRMVALANLLNLAAAGQELPNRVDVLAGY